LLVTARRAVAGAALLALAAGCGTESPTPEPLRETTATDEATPTPTRTEEPTETPIPGETREDGSVVQTGPASPGDPEVEAQVEAFVADYLAAQNEATRTGDFAVVDTMITDDCTVCVASQDYITEAYDSGGEVKGGLYDAPQISVGAERDGEVSVRVDATITAYKTTNGSGEVTDQGPAEKQSNQYSVARVDGEWRIVSGSVVR